jgi:hypothetical protein
VDALPGARKAGVSVLELSVRLATHLAEPLRELLSQVQDPGWRAESIPQCIEDTLLGDVLPEGELEGPDNEPDHLFEIGCGSASALLDGSGLRRDTSPTPFAWTKPEDAIIKSQRRMPKRITTPVH